MICALLRNAPYYALAPYAPPLWGMLFYHLRSPNTHSRTSDPTVARRCVPKEPMTSRCVGSRGAGSVLHGRPAGFKWGVLKNVGRGSVVRASVARVELGRISAGVGAASVVELPAVPLPSRYFKISGMVLLCVWIVTRNFAHECARQKKRVEPNVMQPLFAERHVAINGRFRRRTIGLWPWASMDSI